MLLSTARQARQSIRPTAYEIRRWGLPGELRSPCYGCALTRVMSALSGLESGEEQSTISMVRYSRLWDAGDLASCVLVRSTVPYWAPGLFSAAAVARIPVDRPTSATPCLAWPLHWEQSSSADYRYLHRYRRLSPRRCCIGPKATCCPFDPRNSLICTAAASPEQTKTAMTS